MLSRLFDHIVVSGSWDRTVQVWDVETRQPLGPPLAAPTEGVDAVAVGRVGRDVVISGSSDQTVMIWDAVSRELLTIQDTLEPVAAIVRTPAHIAVATARAILTLSRPMLSSRPSG
jgi:WD40 repeat protein